MMFKRAMSSEQGAVKKIKFEFFANDTCYMLSALCIPVPNEQDFRLQIDIKFSFCRGPNFLNQTADIRGRCVSGIYDDVSMPVSNFCPAD